VARLMLAALTAFFIGTPHPARAQVSRWAAEIAEASQRFKIPEDWIARVMKAESDGRTSLGGMPVVSPKGAMGLMQLMPGTWAEMRAVEGLGSDPFDPHDNIIAGAAYLRLMYDRFGYPGLFAAYNAGPRRYAEHLLSVVPLPPETRLYLAKTATLPRSPISGRNALPDLRRLFVVSATPNPPQQAGGPGGLFAVRH